MSQRRWQESAWSRRVLLGGIAFGGIAGCVGLYYVLGLWEQSRREAEFRLQVEQQFHTIETHLRNTFGAVEAVGAFFRASQYVEPEEFTTFVRPLLAKYPCLHEIGWAGPAGDPSLWKSSDLPVPASKSNSSSLPAPVGGKESPAAPPDGSVVPPDTVGHPAAAAGTVPSRAKQAGLPPLKIHYLELCPQEASGRPFLSPGTDLTAVEGVDAVLRELRSGKEAAIGRVLLGPGPAGPRWAFLIGVSVRRSVSGSHMPTSSSRRTSGGERQFGGQDQIVVGHRGLAPSATAEGLVFGISEPSVLLEHPLTNFPGEGIDIYWYEGQPEENGRLIYYRSGASGLQPVQPLSGRELAEGISAAWPMELFGQRWYLYGVPSKAFLARWSSRMPELILAGGLMGVCLLVAYVHTLFSRHTQVQALVERRTGELQKARDDLLLREESLRDTQALYRSLVEGLPVPILRKNRQGRFTFANQAFCRLLKRPVEEILGKTDFDFYPSDLAAKYQADDQWVLETGQLLETVEENVQDGERRYVQVTKFPVRDVAGQITEIQVLFWDVTERRRAELALEKERTLLHTLMDYLPDNIYFKDRQSRFVRINRAMARYLGLTHPAQAEGKTDFDFFSPEHAEQALADEQYILATGRAIVHKEEKETWPDGRVSWVLTTKLPLRDAEGRIIGTYGISRNITEQKLAAEALKAAKEAAETASQAKSQFLANVSHELRSPLHGLLGLAELVLDGPLEPAQRAYLEMMRDAGENLLLVLNDLLDFSKIEAARLALEQIPFRLRELLAETLKSLAFLAHGKGLALVWYVRPDVPELLVGDPLRLRQIVGNLVANAIKFTEQGEIGVEIGCLERQADRVELQVQVWDTGIGIPPEKLDSIFEMFEQAERSTARRYGGVGLGLAICSRLVALMQGRIWAESQPGQGSRFHFTAWFGLPEQPEVWPPAEQVALLQNRRIVVWESHPVERHNLEGLLRAWAVQPIWVANRAEAKAYWASAGSEVDGLLCGLLPTEAERAEMLWMLDGWLAAGGRMVWLIPAGCPPTGPWSTHPEREASLIKPYSPSELLGVLLWVVGAGPTPIPARLRPQSSELPALRPLRILVAEDSPVGQQLAVGLLERYGHKVTLVRTGREALAAVQSQPFDLVLMDLQMPEMDGYEAAKAIREWEKDHGGHIPILAVTAYECSEELAKAQACGMDQYLGKPLRARQLLQAIGQLVPQAAPIPHPGVEERSEERQAPVADASAVSGQGVDWQSVLAAVRADEPLLRSLLQTLLEEAPRWFQRLREAAAQQDAAALRLAAHSLKGSIRLLGSTPVYQQAWAIEQLAQTGSFPSVETMRQLEENLQRLLQELKSRLG